MCLFRKSSSIVIPPPPPAVPINPEPIQSVAVVEPEAPVFGDQGGGDGLRGRKAALRRRKQGQPRVDTSHVGLGIPSIPKNPATGGAVTSKRPQIPRI